MVLSKADFPKLEEREVHFLSPEARRQEAQTLRGRVIHHVGPGTRAFRIIRRTIVGTWNDGFIHAGNLAYLTILAIFPFFILGSAVFTLFGEQAVREDLVRTFVTAMPPTVGKTIGPVARDVMGARSGWLLWVGAGIGLWTASSLVETIRDILRRAYGTYPTHAFWKYRLFSVGLILAAVVIMMFSLFAQVMIGAAQQVIDTSMPQLSNAMQWLHVSLIIPALGLVGSLYMLFYILTPARYRARRYPKLPGAVLTALWWMGVTSAMPPVLRNFFTYNLTYGSLAGIMIALIFFWLVGLGLVIGAELNAALAVTPEEEAAEDETEDHATQAGGEC